MITIAIKDAQGVVSVVTVRLTIASRPSDTMALALSALGRVWS